MGMGEEYTLLRTVEQNIEAVDRMRFENEEDPMEEEPPLGAGQEGEEQEEGILEEMTEDEMAEFSLLNRQLDQLDQALDAIEEKNDDIHSKLRELLEESRQARKDMESENQQHQQN